MAIASIITVGILFMIEDRIAAMNPIDIVAINNPCSALALLTLASTFVIPAFINPNTTTYITIVNTTIFHGVTFITTFVSTASIFLAIIIKSIAIIPATIDTGRLINSLTKYPITSSPRTYHEIRNIFISLIASSGFFKLEISYFLGMLFLK